ncbi:hypothetical protein ACWCP6_07270 [Streptomyces sp. NPDC002004]
MNKYTRATAGLFLSLGLVAGCGPTGGDGSDDRGKDHGPAAQEGGAKAGGPAYGGPAIPGLAARQAWSLPPAKAIDLGDALLFAKDAKGTYAMAGYEKEPVDGTTGALHMSDEPEPLTLEFRDVKTGAVRKTLKVKADQVVATTWHDGVPALEVRTTSTKQSDGLSAEKKTATVTVYGSDGTLLGKAEHDADTEFHVLDGYFVDQAGDAGLRLTPVDGGTARTVTCSGEMARCSFDPRNKEIDGGQAHAPLITGKYAIHVENATTYTDEPEQLVMSDLATGKKVWSTADVTPPKGVELNDDHERTSGALRILDVRGGRVLTAWGAGALSPSTWVTATYDLASGKQIGGSTTYSYEDDPTDTVNTEGSSVFSPDHELAAAATKAGTAVWRPAGGTQVWTQGGDEHPLTPLRFSPGGDVLYGTTAGDGIGGGEKVLAVDARTKKVLAKDLPADNVPLSTKQSGYGYFTTDKGFFVFPARAR